MNIPGLELFLFHTQKNQHLYLLLIFKQATYSLICLSLVAAMVLLRALDPSGPAGVTLVTVPVPTNQCTDTQPQSPCPFLALH